MATETYDGLFDANPPTYPGYLPWRLTGLIPITEIGRGTGDYRIDPEHLPSSDLAVRLDLFGEVPFDQWFGPIIPLPSFQLTGAFIVTIVEIQVSYWNWLTTGFAGRIIYPEGADQQFLRPMTFNYSISDKYKETMHYGADILLLVIIRTLGIVEVVDITAFLPFLEHRTQSRMKKTRIDHVKVGGMTLVQEGGVYKYLLTTDAGLEDAVEGVLQGVKATIYVLPEDFQNRKDDSYDQYQTVEAPVLELRGDSVFVVDATQFVPEGGGTPPQTQEGWAGALFQLDRSIQVEDPAVMFSERVPYVELTALGYQTQDQDIMTSGGLEGIFVNPQEYIPTINLEIERLQGLKPEDEGEQTEKQKTIEELQALVIKLGTQDPAVDDLLLFPVAPEGTDPLGGDLRYILQISRLLNKESIFIQVGIRGGTLSRQNFHSGSQDDQYITKRDASGAVHRFQIRQHRENGIFLVNNRSSSSWADLDEFLLDMGDVADYSLTTEKFWVVNDITTGPKRGFSGNNDLNAALFWSKIEWMSVTDAQGDLLESAADFSGDSLILFDMKLSDDSYYTMQQLQSRYLADVEQDVEKSVPGWQKYRNWKLWNYGRTISFEIVDVREVDVASSSFRVLVRPGNLQVTFDESGNPVFESTDNWWISFDELFSVKSPFNYISTPRLQLAAALSHITPVQITFSGYYIGSPMRNIQMIEGQNIALQEDSNVFYSSLTARPLYSSTILAFKSISYYYDGFTDAGYILYTRDDDQSNSLYIRQGRVDCFYDIVEFLVYTGEPETLDIVSSKTGSGTETQTMLLDDLGERDIVGLLMNRADMGTVEFPDDDSTFDDTIWTIRLGDKTLSFPSTSKLENTIYTRKAYEEGKILNAVVVSNVFVGAPASDIRFYKTYEPFGKKQYIRYQFAASTRTGDPEVGDGNTLSFVPVLTPIKRAEFTADSKILAVSHDRIIDNATSQALFPYRGGGERLILYVNSQGTTDQVITATTAVLNVGATKAPIAAANDDYASVDNPFGIDVNQNGVFMIVSTDDFYSYIGGGIYRPIPAPAPATIATEDTTYQFPLLIAPNTTQAAYVINDDRVGVAGYTKIQSGGEEVTTLSYYEVNAMKTASDTVYAVNTADGTSFLHANFYGSRRIALTTAQIEGVTDGAFTIQGLTPEPLTMASDGRNRIVIFQNGDFLDYIISSSEGAKWSYVDDVFMARATTRVSAPKARIHNDVLRLFYMEDKERLMYKEMSWPNFLSFHGRLLEKQSSKEKNDEKLDSAKQEFQALLDNIESKQVATTFEQQVDFTVNNHQFVTVVYFDEVGLVQAARSTDSGGTWNDSPANY